MRVSAKLRMFDVSTVIAVVGEEGENVWRILRNGDDEQYNRHC